MSLLLPKAPLNKHNTYYKSLNPKPVRNTNLQLMNRNTTHTTNGFSKLFGNDDGVSELDSYSEIELKKLKDKLILEAERIKNLVKQIEAREAEDVELRKRRNCKITGQKRVMPMIPEREIKRKRVVETMQLKSVDTRKFETVMMKKCVWILERLRNHSYGCVFDKPVDVVASGLSDYHKIVKIPMDLGTVKSKLDEGVYTSPIDFARDVRLTFDNALLYHPKGDHVNAKATVLLGMFNNLFNPPYKRFEMERKEHQKFDKPLPQIRQPQVVSSQRDSEKPTKLCEEADKKSVSEQKRMVPEATQNPQLKREMSVWERGQVALALGDLAEEYVNEILQILAKRNPNLTIPDGDGEVEIDTTTLDNDTMWDLNSFVRLKFKAGQMNKSPVTIQEGIDIADKICVKAVNPLKLLTAYLWTLPSQKALYMILVVTTSSFAEIEYRY